MMISVVMCSRTQADADAAARMYAPVLAGVDHEIVPVIGATSMGAGYNEGARRARGDIIILSHDDIEILGDDFADRLTAHLQDVHLVGVAGTRDLFGPTWYGMLRQAYGQIVQGDRQTGALKLTVFGVPSSRVERIQALDGVFMAARRTVVEQIPFDESIPGFHLYDLDFSYRAYRSAFKVAVACDLYLLHWAFGDYGSPEWEAAAAVFMRKHGAMFTPLPYDVPVTSRAHALAVMRGGAGGGGGGGIPRRT